MTCNNPTATATADKDPHPILAEAIRTLDESRATILALEPHAVIAAELAGHFADRFTSVRPYVTTLGGDVWIELYATDVADVLAVRRWLAARGYRLTHHGTYPDDRRETHSLHWRDGAGKLTRGIILNVHFPTEEGAACRYVEVGTKTVPVYELRCEKAT